MTNVLYLMEEHLFFLFLRILKNRGKLHADSTNIMGQEGFFPNLPVRTYPDIFYSGGLRRGIGDFNRDFYQQTQKGCGYCAWDYQYNLHDSVYFPFGVFNSVYRDWQ